MGLPYFKITNGNVGVFLFKHIPWSATALVVPKRVWGFSEKLPIEFS